MDLHESRKQTGELMSRYFRIKDFLEEMPEHPNFTIALHHLLIALVWAKEGIGVVNDIGEIIDGDGKKCP